MESNELSHDDRRLIALYGYSLLALVSSGKWDEPRAVADLASKFNLMACGDPLWRSRMRAVSQLLGPPGSFQG